MKRIVMKFGGTSMASSASWKQVKDIVNSNKNVAAVVVSAPGKCESYNLKVTDILKNIASSRSSQEDWSSDFSLFVERFEIIANELSLDVKKLSTDFEHIKDRINEGCSEAEILSRGEYLTAKLFAEYCNLDFLDAYDVVTISQAGKPIFPRHNIPTISSLVIVPGYYGRGEDGSLTVFSRGGSDVSGAYLSIILQAEYERWSDTPVCFTDPRMIKNARIVQELTYAELGNIATVVPNILHPNAAQICIENSITVYIKNTQEPLGIATRITSTRDYSRDPIAGIHMQSGYVSFTLQQSGMDEAVGYIYTFSEFLKILTYQSVLFQGEVIQLYFLFIKNILLMK